MKTLLLSIIVIFMFAFFFTFYMENSHDAHATCVTINGTEECSTLPPLLTSIKSHYVPNETIQLVGDFSPSTMIQIDLVDPNDNIKNSVLVQSDSSGSFQSKMVVPNDAVNGTWKINTSSGLNHGTQYITVISKNLQDNQTNTNHSNSSNFSQYPMTPLQQFKSGTPVINIKCENNLQLIIKAEDYSPACVTPNTANILVNRSWALNYANVIDKESISLSAYQGVSNETFYNNGTVASDFTVDVNINNFVPTNTSLVLQIYYNDGILYKTVNVPPDMIQPDGFYKYQLIAVSDANHPVPFKVVATYNNKTAITYAPVFAHP